MTGAVFRLHVLPARVGDALVLEYGMEGDVRRVVIDGGVAGTAQPMATFLGATPPVEMMMVSHVDNDHIAGLLKMLQTGLSRPTIGDFWFNGFRHLPNSGLERMGPPEGERLTEFIVDHNVPWNANSAFAGGAVTTGDGVEPVVVTLPGGLACRILSPGWEQLARLRPVWAPAVRDANLDPAAPVAEEELRPPGRLERMGAPDLVSMAGERSRKDDTETNGSSIAVLASWAGRTVLLAGDAHPDVLLDTLDRQLGAESILQVDVFKLPHHGSKANVTEALTKRVQAKCYVFSTSGEGNYQHPNDTAVARVITHSSGDRLLAFNYRNKRTEIWDDPELRGRWAYRTMYPTSEAAGIMIDLIRLCPDGYPGRPG